MKEVCNNCKYFKVDNFKFKDKTMSATCIKHTILIRFVKSEDEEVVSPRFCRHGNTREAMKIKPKKEQKVNKKRGRQKDIEGVKEARKRFLKGEKIADIAKDIGISRATLNKKFDLYKKEKLINDENLIAEIWREINEQGNITG